MDGETERGEIERNGGENTTRNKFREGLFFVRVKTRAGGPVAAPVDSQASVAVFRLTTKPREGVKLARVQRKDQVDCSWGVHCTQRTLGDREQRKDREEGGKEGRWGEEEEEGA